MPYYIYEEKEKSKTWYNPIIPDNYSRIVELLDEYKLGDTHAIAIKSDTPPQYDKSYPYKDVFRYDPNFEKVWLNHEDREKYMEWFLQL